MNVSKIEIKKDFFKFDLISVGRSPEQWIELLRMKNIRLNKNIEKYILLNRISTPDNKKYSFCILGPQNFTTHRGLNIYDIINIGTSRGLKQIPLEASLVVSAAMRFEDLQRLNFYWLTFIHKPVGGYLTSLECLWGNTTMQISEMKTTEKQGLNAGFVFLTD